MAGYSGRPQAAKLGLKAGQRVVLVNRPDGWQLSSPPGGIELLEVDAGSAAKTAPDTTQKTAPESADVVLAFFTAATEIGDGLPGLGKRIFPAGALWLAWPRRAAGHRSDITDNVIRELALPLGLVDVKVAAIDEDWSGLKLVWRVENRT